MAAGSKDWYDLYDTPCQPERGIYFHHQIAGGGREICCSHRQGKLRIFGVCWPCKTCMVISVKSRKILTCIDLHHTVSLNGGLDGCSSILKAQYSQSTPQIFGKEIVSKNDCWDSLWKTTVKSFASDMLSIACQQLLSSSLIRRVYIFILAISVHVFLLFEVRFILEDKKKKKSGKNVLLTLY